MNENAKTMLFAVVAVVLAGVAYVARPTMDLPTAADVVGQRLFPDFTDPLKAATLSIFDFDEAMGEVRPFQVKRVKGVWSIPSHDNYPADAKDQVARAATSLMQLKVLQVASDQPGEHATYGVIDPDPKTLKAGATGVGTRVVMTDDSGKTLIALIIGKTVSGPAGQRYVRQVGQDQVYAVKLSTDALSTKFEDWIEKDLLKMDVWDMQQVRVRDYAVDALNMALMQRSDIRLAYNDTGDPKWSLAEDKEFAGRDWRTRKLADDEELNTTKLDEMKTAFSDLKIIDIQPKPKGLSADLKAADDFTKNREALQSLQDRGFYPARITDKIELFSNKGEVQADLKSGVRYVLRFGEIAPDVRAGVSKKDEKKEEKKDDKKDEKKSKGVNRFIFVTTEFNADAIAKPQLEPLPEEKKAEEKKPEEKKPADKKPEEKKADTKPADKKADEKKAEPAKDEAKKDAKPEEKKPEEKKADEKKPEEKKDLKAERERIEKENKRKQDEYDAKVKEGQQKVKDLNARFADWYYIISDDTYQKIRLSRTDIVKKKEKKDEKKDEHAGHDHGAAPMDFDALKANAPGAKK